MSNSSTIWKKIKKAKTWQNCGTDLYNANIVQCLQNSGINCDEKALAAIGKGYKGRCSVCGLFGHKKCDKPNDPQSMPNGNQSSQ